MWVWVNSGSWWWIGRPGVLQLMGSQRVEHDWATELNWTEGFFLVFRLFISLNSLLFFNGYTIFINICKNTYQKIISPSCSLCFLSTHKGDMLCLSMSWVTLSFQKVVFSLWSTHMHIIVYILCIILNFFKEESLMILLRVGWNAAWRIVCA